MAFDPVTLLTASAVPAALGGLMLHGSRGGRPCDLLFRSGAALLCLGAGFAMLLAAPTDVDAPVRVLGHAALVLPYGLLWGAARRFDRRSASFEAVSAGALAWLLAAALLDPSRGARLGLISAIVAAYSLAAAFEHRRGPDGLPAQRRASRVFTAHGGAFALFTLLGPAFGLAPGAPDVGPFWGAVFGLETAAFAAALALASTAMIRERAAGRLQGEGLEDPLTGIGNRRALDRSGAALLDACRGDGRPACLLLMDLDGLERVNGRHGHPAGDRLLVAFARLTHDYLPPASLVCRVGGGAFAALLPGADLDRARAVADEIRALFAHVVLDDPHGPLRATVSVGVAEGRTGPEAASEGDLAELMGRADLCLRAAKHGGRDRVAADSAPSRHAAA